MPSKGRKIVTLIYQDIASGLLRRVQKGRFLSLNKGRRFTLALNSRQKTLEAKASRKIKKEFHVEQMKNVQNVEVLI
ncbi:MAG: hypothetical protein NWF06_01050 [Candidatus Bathyarchaeota archaeon]|nr:hypothetical protein [Candidatus Bathyarchaeum sp.]